MEILTMLWQPISALLILSILIIIHEFGHFIFAKATGIKVLEFSLFMGPKIFSKTYGETEYSIRTIPIGGYVKMEGEESESEDERAFNKRPIWARATVVLAGPVLNLIYAVLAIALATYLAAGFYQIPKIAAFVQGVSPAQQAGMQVGDTIVSMNNEKIYSFIQVSIFVVQNREKPIDAVVKRGQELKNIKIIPEYNKERDRYLIGIEAVRKSDFPGFIKYSVLQSAWYTDMTFKQLGLIISGQSSFETLAGPVGIVTELGKASVKSVNETIKDVFIRLLQFSAMISLSLGVLNLLPIPALDGSRLVILAVEAVRRKQLTPQKEAMISMVGFTFLILLMVLVTVNDIRRLFLGRG